MAIALGDSDTATSGRVYRPRAPIPPPSGGLSIILLPLSTTACASSQMLPQGVGRIKKGFVRRIRSPPNREGIHFPHRREASMSILVLAAVQALLSAPPPEESLPRSFDPDRLEPAQREPIYPWIGIEPVALWTAFSSNLHVENVWGYGADATVTLDYGTSAFLGFRAGYIGWNTRAETAPGVHQPCWIRQYRIGIYGEFPFRFLEVGIGANVGGYRFRSAGVSDTA